MRRTSSISTGWEVHAKSWLENGGYLGYGKLLPLPARVPGHVHLDLVRCGVIAHPSEALHEIGAQWVDREHWVYRARFDAQPSDALPRRRLRFEGLDTVSEVWLNGERLAFHDNMFLPLEVNVDGVLRLGSNEVEVHFAPAAAVGSARRTSYFREHGLDRDLVRFDERAFVRKAAYMFGWDWGPRLVSAGIWRPVHLVEFAARILDVQVVQDHGRDGSVRVSCATTVEGQGRVLHFWQAPEQDSWTSVEEGETLELRGAALWWPAGSGEQPLYRLESYLLPDDTSGDVSRDGAQAAALDVCRKRVGLRRVSLIQESDDWGRSFRFEVNGQRLWCVGANWIPEDSFPSQVTRERLRERLLSAVSMNMNMLRVWGGGYYESDEFYELCDELGLLVWQDFPFACSYAPDDALAIQAVEEEARAAIVRLRNHASLAVWCGNNENLMMFEAKWDDAAKHPGRCHGDKLWNTLLPDLVRELDPERPYLPSSPFSPESGLSANADECGDQHNWDVWHGRGDWPHYRASRARFVSEYGFAASPSLRVWSQVYGALFSDVGSLDVRHFVARWHDKTKKGYDVFLELVERHYGPVRTLEEWAYASQLNQRDALTAAIEHYRASDFCNGSLLWQLNDCYPAQSWSVLEYGGGRKAAAHELSRLYAPALACVSLSEEAAPRVRVACVLDNQRHGYRAPLVLEVRDSVTGERLRRWQREVELAPGQRQIALDEHLAGLTPERSVLWCDWGGFTSKRLMCEPRELRTAEVGWRAWREGGRVLLLSTAPALDVWVIAPEVESSFFSMRASAQTPLIVAPDIAELELRWLGGKARVPIEASAGEPRAESRSSCV